MRKSGKSYWVPMACNSAENKARLRAYFSPLCDDMVPESAEVLCDAATDREKKLKVVMVDKNGKRHVAISARTRGGSVITLKAA